MHSNTRLRWVNYKLILIRYCYDIYFLQDLLSLEADSLFEEHFFHFRSSVKGFEKQLVVTLKQLLDHTPSLQAKLRVVEMFQGVFKREAIMVSGLTKLNRLLLSDPARRCLILEFYHYHQQSL